jgi:hypothetical protein
LYFIVDKLYSVIDEACAGFSNSRAELC